MTIIQEHGLSKVFRVVEDVTQITLVTFILWFSEHKLDVRMKAIVELLQQSIPDVVALQEMKVPMLHQFFMGNEWLRQNYNFSDKGTFANYAVVLLSRIPFSSLKIYPLPSELDRKLVLGEFHISGVPLSIGSSHLESYDDDIMIRKSQIETVFRILESSEHSVFMGDFNFSNQNEEKNLPLTHTDVWTSLRPGEPGGTFGKRRLDRILVNSSRWRPMSIRMIGTEMIEKADPNSEYGDVYPSDHFGLEAVLQLQ